MTKVGDLRATIEEMKVEWRIPDFFSLSDEVDKCYVSPSFQFLGDSWHLGVYPNKQSARGTKGWIAVLLFADRISSPVSVAYSFGFKKADGEMYKNLSYTYVFEKCVGYGSSTFMKRSELIEKKATLVPSDVLTITCCVKKHVPSLVSRTEELSRDLKFLLEAETESDVTVRVEEEPFRLHRIVLEARSSVLVAMWDEAREETTGVVTIEDCRPDVFRSFTRYLYTGKVEELSADNVFDLFKVASKYNVEDLADDCVNYMKDTLTIDTLCRAIEVALDHGRENLLKKVINLLSDKGDEFLLTDQWQSLLSENPHRAYDLLKKAFDNIKQK